MRRAAEGSPGWPEIADFINKAGGFHGLVGRLVNMELAGVGRRVPWPWKKLRRRRRKAGVPRCNQASPPEIAVVGSVPKGTALPLSDIDLLWFAGDVLADEGRAQRLAATVFEALWAKKDFQGLEKGRFGIKGKWNGSAFDLLLGFHVRPTEIPVYADADCRHLSSSLNVIRQQVFLASPRHHHAVPAVRSLKLCFFMLKQQSNISLGGACPASYALELLSLTMWELGLRTVTEIFLGCLRFLVAAEELSKRGRLTVDLLKSPAIDFVPCTSSLGSTSAPEGRLSVMERYEHLQSSQTCFIMNDPWCGEVVFSSLENMTAVAEAASETLRLCRSHPQPLRAIFARHPLRELREIFGLPANASLPWRELKDPGGDRLQLQLRGAAYTDPQGFPRWMQTGMNMDAQWSFLSRRQLQKWLGPVKSSECYRALFQRLTCRKNLLPLQEKRVAGAWSSYLRCDEALAGLVSELGTWASTSSTTPPPSFQSS